MEDSTDQDLTHSGVQRDKSDEQDGAAQSQRAPGPTTPAVLPPCQALTQPPLVGLVPVPYQTHPGLDAVKQRLRLLRLMNKAHQFLQSEGTYFQFSPCLYRDKSFAYYIRTFRGGLMEVYKKNRHGDQLSPINGRLDGLFFSVSMDRRTGMLPTHSIYGELRLHVPPLALQLHDFNLYFTDFYCISKPHYVTLVITRPGSRADQFCTQNLLQLDWKTNAFLRVQEVLTPGGLDLIMFVTSKVWVHVFFTENIIIPPNAHFQWVHNQGYSSERKQGGPKNPNCLICNVHRL